MSDFWDGYEPEPTKPAPITKDELTEPLGCVVVRPLVANSTTPPASPVQEPVAWTNWRELAGAKHYQTPGWEMYADKRNPDDVALYTAPPAAQRQWVGLTDDEFENIELGCRSTPFGKIEAMRKVEAKLKEKNGGVV
jgi:hypothetical protein